MREVAPGDLIFSFVDTRIVAIGTATSYCWESPKPAEFGSTGQNWENVGWKVKVSFMPLAHKVRPKEHMDVLRTVLPAKYSPLQPNGNGLQSIYLTEVASNFAELLAGLIGSEATSLIRGKELSAENVAAQMGTGDDLDYWEHRLEEKVVTDANLGETDREAIIRARRGQGLFKQRVMEIEKKCRITGVSNPVHLLASHCKPWRDSNNEERLNGENGLLLTPSVDHLFDRGFIGFENSGHANHFTRRARGFTPKDGN
jgi:hypothetical protein